MKIEVLGCSGSVAKGYYTTSLLVNDNLLVDAGSAASRLENERLSQITDIFLTHSHLDHIKELPFIIDAINSSGKKVNIWASSATLETLKNHVFNGLIWPDMINHDYCKSLINLINVPQGWFDVGLVTVMPFAVDHIKGSLGYVLKEKESIVIFSGDTSRCSDLVRLSNSFAGQVKMIFIECSFPDKLPDIARETKHLTPIKISECLKSIDNKSTKIVLYHVKPKYLDEIISELHDGMELIRGGEVFEI